jgi:hypothetical protein
MGLVCLVWESPPPGRWGGPGRNHRLRRRLLEIWLPQLRARGVRLGRIELDSTLRLWLHLPEQESAWRLGYCLQGRARRLLARDQGVPLHWPGLPRLECSSPDRATHRPASEDPAGSA